jgi:hypothetical protein
LLIAPCFARTSSVSNVIEFQQSLDVASAAAHAVDGGDRVSLMRWFRTNGRFGSGLALFALALQFYLAFGHIHPDDIYGNVGRPLSSAAEIALPSATTPQSITADHAVNDDQFCAICETMFMLGSSATPQAPQFLAPAPIVRAARHFSRTAALFVAPRRAAFQSRAPPVA